MRKLKSIISFLIVLSLSLSQLGNAENLSPLHQENSNQYTVGKFTIESNGKHLWLKSNSKSLSFEELLHLPKLTLPKVDDELKNGINLNFLYSTRKIEVLSIVGSIASIRVINTAGYGVATQPSGESTIYVLDFRNPNKKITLTQFFNAKEILEGFANSDDDELKKAGEDALKDDATTLNSLFLPNLPKSFAREFVFFDTANGYLTVSFRISSGGLGSGLDNDQFYNIQLKTPIKLRHSILNAKQLKSGFLCVDRHKGNLLEAEETLNGVNQSKEKSRI